MKLRSREHARELDDALQPIDWAIIPEGVRRVDIDAPSGRIASIESGRRGDPRVLLVPGATGSKEDFVRMMPALVAQGFFVQSFDLAGQYESHQAGPENCEPPRRSYDMELFVADFLHVLDQEDTPVHVLGYSFAGNLAQEVCARRAERIASITFLSAPPVPGQAFLKVKRIGWISPFTNGTSAAWLMMTGIRRNWIPVPADRLRFVRQRFSLTRRRSVADILTLMKKTPNRRLELRAANIPKLVAVGQHDLWPVDAHAEFATAIGARLAVYEAGHSPCEQTPNQLVWDMLEMIRGDRP